LEVSLGGVENIAEAHVCDAIDEQSELRYGSLGRGKLLNLG